MCSCMADCSALGLLEMFKHTTCSVTVRWEWQCCWCSFLKDSAPPSFSSPLSQHRNQNARRLWAFEKSRFSLLRLAELFRVKRKIAQRGTLPGETRLSPYMVLNFTRERVETLCSYTVIELIWYDIDTDAILAIAPVYTTLSALLQHITSGLVFADYLYAVRSVLSLVRFTPL